MRDIFVDTFQIHKIECFVLVTTENQHRQELFVKLKNASHPAVVVASNGREALEILEGDVGQTIDVILTDNLMPEVCRQT